MSHDASDIRRELREARNAKILRLHSTGLPNATIAVRMGMLPGQVDRVVKAAGLRGNRVKMEHA